MSESQHDAVVGDEAGLVAPSRRAFLVSAAGLTGVAVASGAWRSPARADVAASGVASPSPGFVSAGAVIDLTLDGAHSGVILSAEGGHATADVITEKLGGDQIIRKHIAGVKYEDVTVSVGASATKAMYEWMKDSFDSKFSRKSGALVVADFNSRAISSLEFKNALISEVGFPALDAASKDAAKMTIKFSPEVTRYSPAGGQAPPKLPAVQKKWSPANFKLSIDGLDTTRVNKIDSFTVKQINQVASEGSVEPAHLEVPDLRLQLPETGAQTWLDWHEDFVIKGNNGQDKEKSGTLVFQATDGTELFTVGFQNLGIFKLTPEKVEAGSQSIRRFHAELYCEQMTFSFPSPAP